MKRLNEDAPSPRSLGHAVPPGLEAIVILDADNRETARTREVLA